MFSYDIEDKLQKKLRKLAKKDPILVKGFKKKLQEIIAHNTETIDTYKNLKSPLQEYKRIHLTKNIILLFIIDKEEEHILFADITHRDNAYH